MKTVMYSLRRECYRKVLNWPNEIIEFPGKPMPEAIYTKTSTVFRDGVSSFLEQGPAEIPVGGRRS